MHRREFHRRMAGGVAGFALGLPFHTELIGLRRPVQGELRVDSERLNHRLAAFGRIGRQADGAHRVAFSDADLEARAFVAGLMEEAGLDLRLDAAGNMLGRRAGAGDGPPLWFGSHIDSVPAGGDYDGPAGTMAAIEVAQTLVDAGIDTAHPLEVVVFTNEEGGKTGSRAMAGELRASELDLTTASGYTIGDGLRRIGGDPDRLDTVLRTAGDVAAYFELHIEQGAVLEAAGLDIGVVEGIVGIKRWQVVVTGSANHAGTTPMDARRDALVAAARFVDAVHREARSMPGRQVATVGRIGVSPGAPNVIPGTAELSLEIRDLSMATIDRLFETLVDRAAAIGEGTETSFAFENFYISHAAPTDENLRDIVEAAATELGLSSMRMPSGAGHDAQSIAQFAPVGMIFVPSDGGISHSPREHTPAVAITNGANVLLHSVLAADRTG